VPDGVPYRDLLRHVARQTFSRIRRRFNMPSMAIRKPAPGDLERIRRFKGLEFRRKEDE